MNIKQRLAALGLTSAIVLAGGTLVAPWEGLSLKPYRDIVGVWTQCYGDTKNVDRARSKTPDECTESLAQELLAHNSAMKKYVKVGLTDYQEAAFTSLTYNIGEGAWSRSTALRRLNEGRYAEACAAMKLFNRAGGRVVQGLVNRREKEFEVCLGNNKQAIEEARRIVALYQDSDYLDILEEGGQLHE